MSHYYLCLPLFFLLLVNLVGCTSNAHFDDKEYRPVGQTIPLNKVISNPKQAPPKPLNNDRYEADGYVHNGYVHNNTYNTLSPKALRYGHGLTIRKIIQTIRIHCSAQPLPYKGMTELHQSDREPLQYCNYQFPKYCGARRFSLIENSSQTALIYHDSVSQRNILDQVHDTENAQAGLWDLADQISVSSPYPEQQAYYQFSGDRSKAWVIGVNNADRDLFGTVYAKAINETLGCF